MGNKTKLNPQRQERIVNAIRLGAPIELACKAGGVDKSTVYRWIEKGNRQDKGVYREFCEAAKEAEIACVESMLGHIQIAAKKSWQAAAWLLERRYPVLYGRFLANDPRNNRDVTESVETQRAELKVVMGGSREVVGGNGKPKKGNGA